MFRIAAIVLAMIINIDSYTQIDFQEFEIDNNNDGAAGLFCNDIDGDGDFDVILASSEDHRIIWYRNDGGTPPDWSKIVVDDLVYSAHSVYCKDMDGDGHTDIVGASYYGNPGIAWWRNNGGNPIEWEKFIVDFDFVNAHEVYVSDVNSDGRPDILGASSDLNSVAWWKNEGGNPLEWTKEVLATDVMLAKSIAAGDMDGDGDIDIVSASLGDNCIDLFENTGEDTIIWVRHNITDNFYGSHRIQLTDINGDNETDVLGAAYFGNQVAWWENSGDPENWTKHLIAASVINACIAEVAYIDDDYYPDVVVTAQGSNEIIWMKNIDGSGTSWTKNTITADFVRPWPLAVCDIDNDMDVDVVSGSSYDGSKMVSWWQNSLITDISHNNISGESVIDIYPNPFDLEIKICSNNSMDPIKEITVYDYSGNVVQTMINESNLQCVVWNGRCVNNNSLPSGRYIVKVTSQKSVKFKSILKL